MNAESTLMRRRRQFLVHSYIYYQLGESIISDEQYDTICKSLYAMQKQDPKLAEGLPYNSICSRIDSSASGYFIKAEEYPPEIVSTAFHLLAYHTKTPIDQLVLRYGRRLI